MLGHISLGTAFFIMMGNEKGYIIYDTYYTVDRCTAQLKFALRTLNFQTTESGPDLDHADSKSNSSNNT